MLPQQKWSAIVLSKWGLEPFEQPSCIYIYIYIYIYVLKEIIKPFFSSKSTYFKRY